MLLLFYRIKAQMYPTPCLQVGEYSFAIQDIPRYDCNTIAILLQIKVGKYSFATQDMEMSSSGNLGASKLAEKYSVWQFMFFLLKFIKGNNAEQFII